MADVYLHSRLCEDTLTEINHQNINQKIAFLGAQGPDPMYYANVQKDGALWRKYADRMHDTNTQKLLIDMVTYLKNNYTDKLYSYVVGFLCHYALDTNSHPYIYYHVGIYKKDDPSTHKYRGMHLKFERTIDLLMIRKELGIHPKNLNLTKKYYPIKHCPNDVVGLMEYLFDAHQQIKHGGQIFKTSTRSMYRVLKHMYPDRTGIKKLLYWIADCFTKDSDMHLTDLSFNQTPYPFDYHNEKKRTWHHPVTNEAYNLTVAEIYQNAKEDAITYINKLDEFLQNKSIDLTKVFTNRSFNSGLDCNKSHPFQYFNLYTEQDN